MDEMTLLGGTLPAAPGPSPDVVAEGRHALLNEIHRWAPSPARRRRQWRGPRRIAVTVAAGAALAVGVTVVQVVHVRSDHGVVPGADAASAGILGERAAAAAEKGAPWVPPRPDQWVLTRSVASGDPLERGRVIGATWTRVRDGAQAMWAFGKVQGPWGPPAPGDFYSPAFPNLLEAADLPTDPDALKAALLARRPAAARRWTTDWLAFAVGDLLGRPLPRELRAAFFRVVSRLDGVEIRPNAADVAGRPGIAFAVTSRSGVRSSFVLDRGSYAYLGFSRDLPHGEGQLPPNMRWPDGLKQIGSALITTKIVDRPGQF